MKANKNVAALVAMSTSIILLLVLQVFWLRNSYEKAFQDLRKESSGLFHTAIMTLRDSLFAQNIEPVKGDTLRFTEARIRTKGIAGKLKSDSISVKEASGRVQIFISSTSSVTEDSIGDFLKPMATTFQRMKGRHSYVLKMFPDTLSIDSIAGHYKKLLANAGIGASFEIKKSVVNSVNIQRRFIGPPLEFLERVGDDEHKQLIFSDTLHTDPVPFNPVNHYSAYLSGVRGLILREISPQIVFAVFVTLLTLGSFLLMYRSIRAQQKLVEMKNDFISNVTHELKTPVATVSVAIEALQNFHALDKPELTKEYLDIARSELNRLTLMTDKILKASVFEEKDVDIAREQINLTALVQQVIASLKIVFEKSGVRITQDDQGDTTLTGSSVHLTNVVYNLLDNALKYGKENPEIGISITGSDQCVVLSVRDNGIGIAPEFRKKIFEKFFRVPTGDVHNVKGYGLGLSYVASVVKSHGGTIDVSIPPNGGSCFTITLPKGNQ